MLGIILAFSTHSLYPWYQDHPHYWGLTPRVDQNVAGVLMALEQSVIMGIALVYIVYRMLNDSEKEAVRQETHDAAWASYRRQLAEHDGKRIAGGGGSRRTGRRGCAYWRYARPRRPARLNPPPPRG